MPDTDVTRSGLVIGSLKRMNLSKNGNPRYRVTFTDGTVADTATDAMVAFGINNPEYRNTPLTVTFTRAGRITYIRTA